MRATHLSDSNRFNQLTSVKSKEVCGMNNPLVLPLLPTTFLSECMHLPGSNRLSLLLRRAT